MICPTCGQDDGIPEKNGHRPRGALQVERATAQRVLEFLNAKTGRNYQAEVNLDFIRARLKAGATEAQCRAVIARKAREWTGDDKMEKYLRPTTLFNREKFAAYLGELPATAFPKKPEAVDADW